VGSPAPKCQWFYNGSLLAGATNWSLKITNFQAAIQGNYQLQASNSSGSVATAPSSLLLYSGLQFDASSVNPTNGTIEVRLVGTPNTKYVIEASTDLVHWVPISTNSPATGLWSFSDPAASSFSQRFYRALPQ
jgi:hypothetical protein